MLAVQDQVLLDLGNHGRNHIVLIAFWAFSHFKPAMELAKVLVRHSSKISIIVEPNEKVQGLIDECIMVEKINMVFLPDSGGRKNSEQEHDLYLVNLKNHLPKILESLNAETPIDAFILEMFTAVALDAIKPFKVPHYPFFTVNAFAVTYMLATTEYHKFLELNPSKVSLSEKIGVKEAKLATENLSVAYHLNCRFRGSVLHPPPPVPRGTKEFYFENECKTMSRMVASAEKVLINSFPEFDQLADFGFMKDSLQKYVPIGPLGSQRYSRNAEKKSEALDFLDRNPPRSVLYIAFGTEFKIKNEEVTNLANALIKINVPCIWSIHESQIEYLPNEFSNSSKRLVLKWSPQIDVLNHPSTRCFLSHCGWNSCLESLQAGRPIICWPIFAEQFINSLLLVTKSVGIMAQGTGLFSTKVVSCLEIEDLVEQFFNDDSFASYHQAASDFREILEKRVEKIHSN